MSSSTNSGSATPRQIVIDTDPGVDDALALMLAFRSPEIEIPLISTVAGNVPVDVGSKNLGRLLRLIRPDVWPSVIQGASRPLRRQLITATHVHGDDGLGGATSLMTRAGAVRYPVDPNLEIGKNAPGKLVALAKRHGRGLGIVALGPLTNIARAILRDPDSMQGIGRLVIMGGAVREPGNVTATAEFNIYVDPDAAAIVMASGIAITLVPLDVTHQVQLTSKLLQACPNTSLVRGVKAFTETNRRGSGCQFMHDPLAVAVAIDPGLVSTESLAVTVETEGNETLGMTVADLRGRAINSEVNRIDVATGVDGPAALKFFCDRVLTPAQGSRPTQSGRVLVVGSANIDLSVSVPALPAPGETVLGGSSTQAFGGKGANQAVAARRAASPVTFVAKVGADDFGRNYRQFLDDEGIDAKHVSDDTNEASGLALIVVDAHGENQIAVASGANMTLEIADLPDFSGVDAKVLIVQLECPIETVAEALRRARSTGMLTVMNTAPARTLPAGMLAVTDYLVANRLEAELLCGVPVSNVASAGKAAQALQNAGAANIIITLGRQGAVCLASNGKRHHVKASKVKTLDTTGAGDTFVGYLASALASDRTLLQAAKLATLAAGVSVTRHGATSSIPHNQDLPLFKVN